MNFDPCNFFLKIQEFIGTLIHLGVSGFIHSHSPTFPGAWNVIPELHFWPTPSQAQG
jgi:hypothetical protein